MVIPTEFLTTDPYSSDWCGSTTKVVAGIRAEIRRTSWTTELDHTLLQCWFLEEHWQRTIDPALQDNVLLADDFAEYIYHIGNAHDMHSIIQGGLSLGGKSLKRDRQSVFFRAVNPMYANQDPEGVQYDLDKPDLRCTKILGESTKIQYIGAIWSSLKEKDCSSIKTRSHAIAFFQHTSCELYWESGVHEDWRGFILQSIPILQVSARRTRAEFATWTSGSTQSRSEKFADHQSEPSAKYGKPVAHFSRTHVASSPKKVSEVSTGKLVTVTLIAEFQVYFTQPSRKKTRIARKPSKDWFNYSRITRTGDSLAKIEGVDHQLGQHGILRALRDFFLDTMPWLRFILGSGHHILHMRQMHAADRKESTVEQGKIRHPVNSRQRHQKKNLTHGARHWPSVRKAMYHKAHNMLRRARKHKKWWLQNHSGKMARWWQIPQVFVRCWVNWGTYHSIRCNRSGRPFLRGHKAWKKSERKILDSFFEERRYSRTSESAQWLCRREA